MDKEMNDNTAKEVVAKKPAAPKPRERNVAIRVVSRAAEVVLVEWSPPGRSALRGYLPASVVGDAEKLPQSALDEAEPYGIDWETAIGLPEVTPRHMADVLHRYGIWSIDDVKHESVKARQALSEVYMVGVLALLKLEDK